MEPTHSVAAVNPDQRAAWEAGRVPDAERLRCGLWSIPVPIPMGTLPATLSYALADDDGVHLIDPGWVSEPNSAHLEATLAAIGHPVDRIATVVVTHHHPDHLGLARWLRERFGARILLSASERRILSEVSAPRSRETATYRGVLERWGVPIEHREGLVASFERPSAAGDIEPDRLLHDGDVLELAGRSLQVVETPGHTGGHICLADHDARLLFTGDHVLPRIYSGVGIGAFKGSDPMGDLVESLDRLAVFDDYEVLPGHEYRFTGLRYRREQIVRHHLRRTFEVAALTESLGAASVWEYARRMTWTSGWSGLDAFWLHSALRQTELHLDFVNSGRAERLRERISPDR